MSTENPYLLSGLLGSEYPGALSVGPIRPQPLGLLGLAPADDESAILERERDSRIPLLFEHFGINPADQNAWERLARDLAAKHVPGFSWSCQSTSAGAMLNLGMGGLDVNLARLFAAGTPAKRRRGRPKKAPRHSGRYGLLGPSFEPKVKRPAHRPARYTEKQKRQYVERITGLMVRLRAQASGAMTQRELMSRIVREDPDAALRLYYRFKRDVDSFDKSHENSDALQILQSFGRSG